MIFRVYGPLLKPPIVALTIVTFLGTWNDYLWPLVITRTVEMKPITVGVRFLFDSEGNNNWGVIMAGTTFVVLPLLIVYIFSQRFIIDGLTAGATKG